jgi:hypothetical protein
MPKTFEEMASCYINSSWPFFLANFFRFHWPAVESLDLAAGHFFLPIFLTFCGIFFAIFFDFL